MNGFDEELPALDSLISSLAHPAFPTHVPDSVIVHWVAARVGVSALACAEAHPVDDSTLCKRLVGHAGLHASDGLDAWLADTDTEEI